MKANGIDFIGDIHGYADELESLLKKMGYYRKGNVWKHSYRMAFFVGDFIDRGAKIFETLNIVRHMVDSGTAKAVMGNHEYNAICFHQEDKNGGHLRKHSIKNILQHIDTLKKFQNRQDDYDEYVEWFKTLPLFYETENFRVVHAAWDQKKVEHLMSLTTDGVLNDNLIRQSAQKGSKLYDSVDTILKGKELELPGDHTFNDKDKNVRKAIRMKWWESPEGHTYDSIAVGKVDGLPDLPIENAESINESVYGRDERPIFFGHYWLKGNPNLYRDNICCLDYSVAKGGKLVAYRFDGEERLKDEKLVFV